MTSFCEGYIKEREPLRQKLAADIERFKAAGGIPEVGTHAATARDYVAKKSQKARNNERKQRLGIDGKPKGTQIKTVADVRQRMKQREAASDRT